MNTPSVLTASGQVPERAPGPVPRVGPKLVPKRSRVLLVTPEQQRRKNADKDAKPEVSPQQQRAVNRVRRLSQLRQAKAAPKPAAAAATSTTAAMLGKRVRVKGIDPSRVQHKRPGFEGKKKQFINSPTPSPVPGGGAKGGGKKLKGRFKWDGQ